MTVNRGNGGTAAVTATALLANSESRFSRTWMISSTAVVVGFHRGVVCVG